MVFSWLKPKGRKKGIYKPSLSWDCCSMAWSLNFNSLFSLLSCELSLCQQAQKHIIGIWEFWAWFMKNYLHKKKNIVDKVKYKKRTRLLSPSEKLPTCNLVNWVDIVVVSDWRVCTLCSSSAMYCTFRSLDRAADWRLANILGKYIGSIMSYYSCKY